MLASFSVVLIRRIVWSSFNISLLLLYKDFRLNYLFSIFVHHAVFIAAQDPGEVLLPFGPEYLEVCHFPCVRIPNSYDHVGKMIWVFQLGLKYSLGNVYLAAQEWGYLSKYMTEWKKRTTKWGHNPERKLNYHNFRRSVAVRNMAWICLGLYADDSNCNAAMLGCKVKWWFWRNMIVSEAKNTLHITV
jgi:hypothetical protein